MSLQALNYVLGLPSKVNGAKRLVMICLAHHADDDGYSYPKKRTLMKEAAIEREETVREVTQWLEAEGLIERIVNGWAGVQGQIPEGKRPNLYRILSPRETGRGVSPDTGEGGSPDTGEQNCQSELPSGTPSPTPPVEGGVQPGLFGPEDGGAVTVSERKTRAGAAVATITEGAYRAWLERWPKGNRGSIPAGSRAFAKAVKGGATMEEIDEQTRHYTAARVAYHEAWAGVGNYWPSLMNVSTFLNGKRTMFGHEWGPDDLRYWPAPAGWSWDDRPVTSHDAGKVPAEIQAQGGLAVAMWRAEQRKAAEAGAVAGG